MIPLEDLFSDVAGHNDGEQHVHTHSVIIWFNYGFDELEPLHALEDRLREAIAQAGVGMLDGHEINMDGSDGSLYMYGPNAEALYKAVKPVLEQVDFMKGATAQLRFGHWNQEAHEIEVTV